MEDERLVQLALSRGFVTTAQVERAKAEQKSLSDRGIDHGVYFLLQDLGFITDEQARELRKSASSSAIRALEVEGFVIQGRIGSGGMGDVFRARHPDGREAAVKLLSGKLARSEEYVRRFLREARATTRLHHPNIVATLGAGEAMGTRYMLMELVDGPSLKTWLVDRGKLDPLHALTVLTQISAALHFAWDNGILHRDVKPANIILGKPRPGLDEPFCAKLCDFGLARVENVAGDADLSHGGLTGTGLALGTPHYMSPEQASGDHDVDQRSDIYGLGATLFHALLGQTLYSGKSSAVIMYKQVTETVDLGQLRSAGVREPLVALLGRMLAKRRADRIASWTEVEAETARIVAATAKPATPPQQQPQAAVTTPVVAVHTPRPATTGTAQPTPAVLPAAGSGAGPMITIAVVVALAVALVVGLLLGGGRRLPTASPASIAGDLASATAQPEDRRELVLGPGTYPGLRLGAALRGLRLRAGGPGVVVQSGSSAAGIACEPGLDGASIAGIEVSGRPGAPAVEVIAGCSLELTDATIRGDLVVSGGTLRLTRCRVDGRLAVGDRGAVDASGCQLAAIAVDRGDLHLQAVSVHGQVEVRNGQIGLDAVRIAGPGPVALRLDHARATIHDLSLTSAGSGIEALAAELPSVEGLSISGPGPSIAWEGERPATWRWVGFDLSTPPRGLAQAVPPGPGARADRLPPP